MRCRRIPMSCLKIVFSTNGLEPPSSILMPNRKGKGAALHSSMWNILIKYDEYLDYKIMILKVFWLNLIPMNYINSPSSAIVNTSFKANLMLLNLAAKLLVITKSSTYRTTNNNDPSFFYMQTLQSDLHLSNFHDMRKESILEYCSLRACLSP